MLLRINWEISNCCNYNCSYCFNNSVKINFNLTAPIITLLLKKIKKLNYSEYEFVLTGGEPTIHPYFNFIISEIYRVFNDKLKSLNVITNISQDISFFDNLFQITDSRFSLRCSLHLKYLTENKFEKLEFFLKNNIKLLISVLLDKNYYYKIFQCINKINFLYMKYNFEPSLRFLFDDSYTENEKTFFNFFNNLWNVKDFIKNKISFYNQYCIFGYNLLIINSDLTFRGSYCKQSNLTNIPIIFLNEKKIKEKLFKIVKCRQSCCFIPTCHLLPKFKNKDLLNNFLKEKNL